MSLLCQEEHKRCGCSPLPGQGLWWGGDLIRSIIPGIWLLVHFVGLASSDNWGNVSDQFPVTTSCSTGKYSGKHQGVAVKMECCNQEDSTSVKMTVS